MARILIGDDEELMRELLHRLLTGEGRDIEVVAEAGDGRHVVEEWRRSHPDVIVLDQEMPGMTGIEAAEIILGEQPDQAIIILTATPEAPELDRAASLGVRQVLSKTGILSISDAVDRALGR